MIRIKRLSTCLLLCMFSTWLFAADGPANFAPSNNTNVIEKKNQEQDDAGVNPYGISLYQPTYVLPFYFTGSPDYNVYEGETPDNLRLTRIEFKGQLSFKIPVWNNMFDTPLSLAGAYTQDMFWQLYSESPYFRETDYEPELFLTYKVNELIHLQSGMVHQSNGRGGEIEHLPNGTTIDGMERSWNRAYADINFSGTQWLIDVMGWTQIFKATSADLHNPDIGNYLGNSRLLLAYKFSDGEVLAFKGQGLFQNGWRRQGLELTWSFPLTKRFKLYLDTFSGYGQSLIEYNHYTNSIAIGLTLNDWI